MLHFAYRHGGAMAPGISETAAAEAGLNAERLQRVVDHLEHDYVEPQHIAGCQLAVARRGELACFASFGHMDLERGRTMADDTLFRIHSMTKPITSVALMQLWERGMFQLNDPVHSVIPAWRGQEVYVSGNDENMITRPARRPMTFRHILGHTAGLSYGGSDHPVDKAYQRAGARRGPGETLQTFVDKLAGVPLYYDPGERWHYSCATDVCGYLVEALSGTPLDRYFEEHIFEPLGMPDTAFSVPESKAGRLSASYQWQPGGALKVLDDPETSALRTHPTFFSGGGGLISTTQDYLRFCEMLCRGGELDGARILGPRTLRLMTRNHLANGCDMTEIAVGRFAETPYAGVGFGLGFAMSLDVVGTGGPSASDFYWGGAASTIMWVDPVEQLSVVFMTQLMPYGVFNFRGELKNMIYAAIED
ncbi:MAG: serine hydrolase [Gammaproteobacteria bacterium]|nr:serine hydrolase [Gammaproteobacteria bacterium]